jgi:hypothetical protein
VAWFTTSVKGAINNLILIRGWLATGSIAAPWMTSRLQSVLRLGTADKVGREYV